MGRRVGWHSGYIEALNLQAGEFDMTAGQTTESVTFDDAMDNVPSVILTDGTTQTVFYSTRSTTGFTAEVPSTGSANTVSWVAFDDDGA